MAAKAKKVLGQGKHEIFRKDYLPPVFLVQRVHLDFDLDEKLTTVRSTFRIKRNPASKEKSAPLVLNGETQKLKTVQVNGVTLTPQNYELDEKTLTLPFVPDEAEIFIESTHSPAKNTALSGLYVAGPLLCTQCESEGFRRITYYPDRPDVLAKFSTTLHADKKKYPTLLANGNLIKKGSEKNGRHFAVWEDPFPKPCYLFALVAGTLDRTSGSFTTKSGRKVLLEGYVEPGRKSETGFMMKSIKDAMAWDEQRFNLEYDLDRFMMVAVSYFNYGAMENKGLNIFNDSCVLGRTDTATDADIAFFERVVGHEYFHNWTGDRVTCQDWFQISLKEGLTVFREQEFCGAMNSPAVERLHTVVDVRTRQFPEDAGAMAHSIRPDSHQEIDNFYTSTVYQKGSEVIRMIQTLVGKKGFEKGLALYLKRHDGHAATCDQFVAAQAEANKIDMKQFMVWYEQAGTPVLDIKGKYDAKKKEYTLTVVQSCPPTPGQPKKKPYHMPLAVGLLSKDGKELLKTQILELKKPKEVFTFKKIASEPVPSLLRDFSAPVNVTYPYSEEDLRLLMGKDTDSVTRWDAAQKLFTDYVLAGGKAPKAFFESLRLVLKDPHMDAATKAMTLALPSELVLGLSLLSRGKKIDPIALYEKRQRLIADMAAYLANDLWDVYTSIDKTLKETASDGVARGQRSLKNLCLAYLNKVEPESITPINVMTITRSKNMTDRIAALHMLADGDTAVRGEMLAFFAAQYKDKPSIMDDWMSVQAAARRTDVLKDVKKLTRHPAFTFKNPNRVSALLGVFAGNPLGFHAADGSGYDFISDMVIKVDKINPHASARMAKAFLRWKDFDAKRSKMMKKALEKIFAEKGLSSNIREIAAKSLGKK